MKTVAKKLTLSKDDILIITVGDLANNIFPTQKDLLDARKFFKTNLKYGKNQVLIVPPIFKFEVLRKTN